MINKNKKIFLTLALFLAFGLLAVHQARAIDFTPSVPLPIQGLYNAEGKMAIGPDSIANYINALYTYGAGFAAILAMFMLVIAGWQWVMAGGQPDKINRAKDIMTGVFVGLALLFGGQLLMSQISTRLVNFGSLNIEPIVGTGLAGQVCAQLDNLILADDPDHNNYFRCGYVLSIAELQTLNSADINNFIKDNASVLSQVQCVNSYCSDEGSVCVKSDNGEECPTNISPSGGAPGCYCLNCAEIYAAGSTCAAYGNKEDLCNQNSCYNATTFNNVCYYLGSGPTGSCTALSGKTCSKNDDCYKDLNNDGDSEWCCGDKINAYDHCVPVEVAESDDDYAGCNPE